MKKYLSICFLFLLLSCAAHQKKKQATPTQNPPVPTKPQAPKVDLKTQIIQESKPGGGLDFFSPIKGHESEEVEVKDGVVSTRLGLALYDWGKANYSLGIKSPEEALEIWAAFKGRAPNTMEKENITLGFRRGKE